MRSSGVADVFCALLLSVLGSEAAVAEQQRLPTAALSNPVAEQSLDELSATLDRPLFSPGRRAPAPPPPPPMQAAVPPAPPPPPNLILLGVVIDGEGARAVVRTSTEKRILRAQIGDDIDGWKVSQIEGRKLVLSLDGRFATFKLFSGDHGRQEAAGGSTPGGEPKNSQRQKEVQQTTAQAITPPSGQPTKRRRSRE